MLLNLSRRAAVCAAGLLTSALLLHGDHSWGSYHWARKANPFKLQLGDNVAAAWDVYLTSTGDDWSGSTVLDTVVVRGGSTSRNCRPTSGRVEVCNGAYGNNGWLGIAQIWASGSHITQGVVKVNDTYFNTSRYNTPAWRKSVMCQEVGHTLGLSHNDEDFSTTTGTCMDYSNDPTTNQQPNRHDYLMLEQIYAHTDSTTTVATASSALQHPQAMRELELDERRHWGKLVRASRNGRVEAYELDFGGGHKVVTFVTWADGEARGRGREE